MTEVNGIRLAYRGFVSGLAGGYAWMAIAMILSGLVHHDPLQPLRPVALAISPLAGSSGLAFVLGLAAVQAAGGLIGLAFAYFFARFFTVRATLRLAAAVVALLAWALIVAVIGGGTGGSSLAGQLGPVLATVGYGVLLGLGVPVRGEVTRQAGSPST